MTRIAIPATIDQAPAAAQPLLQAVAKQIGSAPNLFRLLAVSPAALEGFLGLSGALGKDHLGVATRNRIALAVAQANECNYCLAAHTALGAGFAKLSDAEMAANRAGRSADAKAAAAVRFAQQVVRARGAVGEGEFAAVRSAGHSDAEIVEIVVHAALNTLTNYLNNAMRTDVDFPAAPALLAA